jgi:outer membrane lipoprotein-sorting protein
MKNLYTLTAIMLVAVSIRAQGLDEILERYFSALGQDKLNQVNTMITHGTSVNYGLENKFILTQKRPDKIRLEVEIQGMKYIQVYDGKSGWSINPFSGSSEPQDMSDIELKEIMERADMDGYLYNWKKKGHGVELIGKEDMEGTEVYKLKMTKKDGDVTFYFIDTDTFILLKMTNRIKVGESEIESDSYLSNYKYYEGVLLPFSIEIRQNGQLVGQLTMDEITVNTPVDDALFIKPVKEEEK